jgi:hypothetical protein
MCVCVCLWGGERRERVVVVGKKTKQVIGIISKFLSELNISLFSGFLRLYLKKYI